MSGGDYIFVVVFLGILFFQNVASDEVSMSSYFPEFVDDPSEIRWAHAVNSRTKLNDAIDDNATMLEADVLLGRVIGQKEMLPVMAHPPLNESDLDLRQWLSQVVRSPKRFGVKLDFKSIEVVQPSLQIIEEFFDEITFPIWLNGDILPGPVNLTQATINGTFQFLHLCKAYFPESTLSLGWSTRDSSAVADEERAYTWEHVVMMAAALHSVSGHSQPVTFPVRASFVRRSLTRLRWLLSAVPGSTLTVWSSLIDDHVPVEDLLTIRSSFPTSYVYYDLPLHLDKEFRRLKVNAYSDVPDAAAAGDHLCLTDNYSVPNFESKASSDCKISESPVIAFVKPNCQHSLDVSVLKVNQSFVSRMMAIVEFLDNPSSSLAEQLFMFKMISNNDKTELILERCGKLVNRQNRNSNVLNATKVPCSKCYAFQVEFLNGSSFEMSFWSVSCLYDEPSEPKNSTDVFKAIAFDGAVDEIIVESHGAAYKVIRNVKHDCALPGKTLDDYEIPQSTSSARRPPLHQLGPTGHLILLLTCILIIRNAIRVYLVVDFIN